LKALFQTNVEQEEFETSVEKILMELFRSWNFNEKG